MKRLFRWLFHFVSYYITWFVCIGYAAVGDPWLGPVIALILIFAQVTIQVVTKSPWRQELLFAIILMMVGIMVDTIFMQTGWIVFKANPFDDMLSPPWLACLWLSFGFTIMVTNRAWLHRYVVLGGLTFISLPFAYWIGVAVGAAVIENWLFYPLLGGIWMVLLPLIFDYQLNKDKR